MPWVLPLVYRVKPLRFLGFLASGQLFFGQASSGQTETACSGFLLRFDWQTSLQEHVGIDTERTQNAGDQS
jgi:hypothetical protein